MSHRPSSAEITVWSFDLDGELLGLDAPTRLLSADELERADRFRSDIHRSRFIRCRAAVRTILGSVLDEEPHRLRFECGPFGKPYVEAHRSLSFNVSHCEGWGVLAVTRAGELGIDVEVPRDLQDLDSLAATVFSPAEMCELRSAVDVRAAFWNGWTRKEAVIKALGTGFSADTRSFSVSLGSPAALRSVPDGGGSCADWTLRDLTRDTRVIALAVRAPDAHVTFAPFDMKLLV